MENDKLVSLDKKALSLRQVSSVIFVSKVMNTINEHKDFFINSLITSGIPTKECFAIIEDLKQDLTALQTTEIDELFDLIYKDKYGDALEYIDKVINMFNSSKWFFIGMFSGNPICEFTQDQIDSVSTFVSMSNYYNKLKVSLDNEIKELADLGRDSTNNTRENEEVTSDMIILPTFLHMLDPIINADGNRILQVVVDSDGNIIEADKAASDAFEYPVWTRVPKGSYVYKTTVKVPNAVAIYGINDNGIIVPVTSVDDVVVNNFTVTFKKFINKYGEVSLKEIAYKHFNMDE